MRPQLIFVDGSWADQAQELADYVQVGEQVKPLLEADKQDEALKIIVNASNFINSVPEKDFTPAYNLLIYVVLQSKNPGQFLPAICTNLLKPITSSPTHSFTLASNALTTIFNLLDENNSMRMNIFMQILKFIKQQGQWDVFKSTLKNLEQWLKDWDADEEDELHVYKGISEVAAEAGDNEESYQYLIKALQTFGRDDPEEVSSEEAQQLSLRAIRMSISSPTHFDFQDLRVLPTVQALSDSHPVYSQLLDIFAEQDLEDYNDFNEEHEGFIEKEKLDHERLQRKMRLLTYASLAASTPSREIPYANIARSLMIPSEDVEMWTIDVIRAGLVEGRLSQKQQTFLVHRTTYRVFGEKQWRELGTRVDQFKNVVDKLLGVIRRQQAEAAKVKEDQENVVQQKVDQFTAHDGRRRGGQPRKQRTDDDD